MGAQHQALLASGVALDPNIFDIPMQGRYETWRETVVADGTAQSQVTDWSGNTQHATQATGTKQPLYKTNQINTSLPVWRFDGVDDFVTTASIAAMNNTLTRWYYLVVKHVTHTNVVNGVFAGANTGNSNIGELFYFLNSGTFSTYMRSVSSTATQSNQDTGINAGTSGYRLYSIVLDGTLDTKKMGPGAYSNGGISQATPAPNGTFTLVLGDLLTSGGGNGANCDIAAVFMGNSALTLAARSRIETYITNTYGVSP